MYSRLNSYNLPMRVIQTENKYVVATDKSCVLLSGEFGEESDDKKSDTFSVGPISTKIHAVHVQMNPKLGNSLQIITPDDGTVALTPVSNKKYALAKSLPWQYRVFIVRIDLPQMD